MTRHILPADSWVFCLNLDSQNFKIMYLRAQEELCDPLQHGTSSNEAYEVIEHVSECLRYSQNRFSENVPFFSLQWTPTIVT